MAGARGEGAAPLQGLFGDVLAIAKDVELAFVVGPISVLARFVESFAGIVDIIVCGDRLAVSSNFVAVGTILPPSYGHEVSLSMKTSRAGVSPCHWKFGISLSSYSELSVRTDERVVAPGEYWVM